MKGKMRQVLDYIERQGVLGATDDEIETVLGLSHQSVSARRYDLADAGWIRPSGQTRKTRSGGQAKVWVVV